MSDTQSSSSSGTGDPELDNTEVDDQPLGVPDELDPEDAPLPGIPEAEPPSSG